MKNLAIDDQAPTDAAAERAIKYRVGSGACPAQPLAQSAGVRVVVHPHRQARERPQPLTQRKLRPAFDLVRAADATRPPVHRAAEADGPRRGIDRDAAPLADLERFVARNDLQLRAANLDAQVTLRHCFSRRSNMETKSEESRESGKTFYTGEAVWRSRVAAGSRRNFAR